MEKGSVHVCYGGILIKPLHKRGPMYKRIAAQGVDISEVIVYELVYYFLAWERRREEPWRISRHSYANVGGKH